MESIDDRIYFSPDSPLFSKSLHDFHSETTRLVDFLKFLIKSMRQFCKEAKSCAKSGFQLSQAMTTNSEGAPSPESLQFQETVSPILSLFSNVFSEYAHSQEVLSDSLEKAFIVPLEQFCQSAANRFFALQHLYSKEKEVYDASMVKYLHSENPSLFARSNEQTQAESRALEVVQSRKRFELTRFDAVRTVNQIESQRSYEVAGACISAMVALRTHHHVCSDRLQSLTSITKEYSARQHARRKQFLQGQMNVDRYRTDIEAVLGVMIERVETQMTSVSSPSNTSNNMSPSQSPIPHDTISASRSPSTSSFFLNPETIFLPSNIEESNNNPLSNVTNSALSTIGNMRASLISMGNKLRKTATIGEKSDKSDKLGSDNLSNSRNGNRDLNNSRNGNRDLNNSRNGNREGNSNDDTIESDWNVIMEVEEKMKALDRSELDALFRVNPMENFAGVVKQGYVMERSPGKLMQQHVWTRKWLVLDESKLYFVKEGESNSPLDVQILCDLMLASVREVRNSDALYCFEIVHANIKSHMIQAEGQREFDSWIECIRGAIERRLTQGISHRYAAPGASSSMGTTTTESDVAIPWNMVISKEDMKRRHHVRIFVEELMKSNRTCAECGKSDPDWVSLNLGCVICIECSGVHRSLGVHISKVRSLTLDELEASEYMMLKSLGNLVNHDIWEHTYVEPEANHRRFTITAAMENAQNLMDDNIMPELDRHDNRLLRPDPKDGYSVREKFIRVKYQKRLFVEKVGSVLNRIYASKDVNTNMESVHDIDDKVLCQAVIDVCQVDDIVNLANLMAHHALGRCSGLFSKRVKNDENGNSDRAINKLNNGGDVNTADDALNETTDSSQYEDCEKIEDFRHPLLVACERGSMRCAVLLIVSGMDVTSVMQIENNTEQGEYIPLLKAALQTAESNGHQDLVKYIKAKMEILKIC